MRRLAGIVLVAALYGLAGCSKEAENEVVLDDYVYAPITNACRYIERLENPNGFEGVISVKELDVRDLDAAAFKKELESASGEAVHLWMPGHDRWLLVSQLTTNSVSLSAVMDAFALAEDAVSPASLFAAYAGRREDILPAFQAKLEGKVLPQWFITKEVPKIDWLDLKKVEADLATNFLKEVRSMQVVRRLVLEGEIAALAGDDKKSEEKSIDCWSRAAKRNPEELFLRERLDRLERNARGFLACGKMLQALKCFETMIRIKPTSASLTNFGHCLKRLGRQDLAKEAYRRAAELRPKTQEK